MSSNIQPTATAMDGSSALEAAFDGASASDHAEFGQPSGAGVTDSGRLSHVATVSGRRLSQCDGLRCLAFLSVFMHHAMGIPLLWMGVDLFFVLSGFLITSILLRSKDRYQGHAIEYYRTFYIRRVLRIFPPYYLFLGVVFLCADRAMLKSLPIYLAYLSNFNDAFGWFPRPGALTPMWSLAVEEQFYLLWPPLVWTLGQRRLAWLSGGLILAAPACRLVVALTCANHWPAYFLLPCRIDLLAAGALLAVFQAEVSPLRFHRATRWGLAVACGSASAFAALTVSLPEFRTGANSVVFNTAGYSLVMAAMLGVLAYLVPRGDGVLGRWLSATPLTSVGMVSYTAYLVHQLVLRQLREWGLQGWLGALAGFVVTLVIAAVSWYAMEDRFQRLKSKIAAYDESESRQPAGSAIAAVHPGDGL